MRLTNVHVNGFRGFAGEQDFDLDADAVVLVGANGSGKTSLFDAVLWGLTGSVARLGSPQDAVVSRYSLSGEARVEIRLRDRSGEPFTVTRRFDGSSHLSVARRDETLAGAAAEVALIATLWPDARGASEPWEALSRSLTRGVYLQQDLVRDFLDADDEQARFTVVGEIIGAGRIAELQRQLDGSRTTWSRATNAFERELQPIRDRAEQLRQRLETLKQLPAADAIQDAWGSWMQRVAAALKDSSLSALPTAQNLDRLLTSLQARERAVRRQIGNARELVRHISERPQLGPTDLTASENALIELRSEVSRLTTELARQQEAAALERAALVAENDLRQRQQSLYALALTQLGHTCPVCGQSYDIEATRARLQSALTTTALISTVAGDEAVAAAAEQLQGAERELASAEQRIRVARQANQAWDRWSDSLAQMLDGGGWAADEASADNVARQIELLQAEESELSLLRRAGEQLSLQLARLTEMSQADALAADLDRQTALLASQEADLADRRETGALATEILTALRDANDRIVAAELERIEPLLQRMFAAVDPHPAFRAVRFLTRTVRNRGQLWTAVQDTEAGVSVSDPATVLSSSQLNVLAVSAFLALNLASESLPLQLAALDDPLQSLDTVNLLGLADLLRRLGLRRQILVSTHDEALASLLTRKLRPVTERGRARVIRLEGWSRNGPIVTQEDIAPENTSLRLVASA